MLVARVHRHSSQFGALNTLFTRKQTDCSKLESFSFTLFSLYLIGVDSNIKCSFLPRANFCIFALKWKPHRVTVFMKLVCPFGKDVSSVASS